MSETCQKSGIQLTSKPARLEGATSAIARWEIGTFARMYTLLYESGEWKVSSTSDFQAELGMPVDRIIATRKADGSC